MVQNLNITWFNLGNTYMHEGKCMEAYDAYSHVATAGVYDDKDITPEMVLEMTKKRIKALDEECTSKVVFKCNPADMDLVIHYDVMHSSEPFACSDKPIPMIPRSYEVSGVNSYGVVREKFEAVNNKQTEVPVHLITYR